MAELTNNKITFLIFIICMMIKLRNNMNRIVSVEKGLIVLTIKYKDKDQKGQAIKIIKNTEEILYSL